MKGSLLLTLVLTAAVNCPRADTIALWNFNSPVPDNDTSTGTTNSSVGNSIASLVGGVAGSFLSGDTAHDPAPSADNSGWQTKTYPAATANNKSAGVRFDANTTGYTNISVSWYQRNSATASRYARLQYTLDGNNFTDANVIAIYADSVFTNKMADFSGVSGVANNPNFGFRLVTEFESTAIGSGTNAYVATATGSGYSTAGTIRFDMVTVSGALLPGANTPPTISSLTNQTIRVNQSSGALPFTVGDAEDPPGSLTVNKASSDPSVMPEASIVFGGSGANRTVTLTAGGQTGSANITLYVIDSGGKSNSTLFTVTVLPLNTAPTVSSLSSTNTLMNTATPAINFIIGDLETPSGSLTVSGSSSNTALVPNGNIVFGGSGASRSVTITPASGQTGVAPIAVTVSDGTNSATSVFPLMVVPATNVIFYDPFTYPNGSLLTNSAFLWGNRSGTVGQCQVTNGQLLVVGATGEDVVGALIGGPYARSNSTVLYAAFKATFLTLPKSTPGYFASFANGSTLRGRIFAGTTNAAPGSFQVLVANGSDTNTTAVAADLSTNTTYTLVTRYNIDSASTTLWLNPAAEGDPGVTASDTQTAVSIASYGFRQDASFGATVLVDDMRVGLSFAAVTGTTATATPIPLKMQRIGNNAVLSWTNSTFALQAAPAAKGTYTNVPNATSPYTNPITATPRFFRLKAN
jgi:hypothetical protein